MYSTRMRLYGSAGWRSKDLTAENAPHALGLESFPLHSSLKISTWTDFYHVVPLSVRRRVVVLAAVHPYTVPVLMGMPYRRGTYPYSGSGFLSSSARVFSRSPGQPALGVHAASGSATVCYCSLWFMNLVPTGIRRVVVMLCSR